MNNLSVTPPKWFWAVGILALFWNMTGVVAVISELYMTPDELNGMYEAEQHFHKNRPWWVQMAFTISVFTGVAGCIALLTKKGIANTFLILSLIGLVAKSIYVFLISDAVSLFGMSNLIVPIVVLVIGILLVIHVRYCTSKGWLS